MGIAVYSFVALMLLASSSIIESKSLTGGGAVFGCTSIDHGVCDDLCKGDSFWYGICAAWDGTDFQCKCFDYKAPLDSKICSNYKEYCNTMCTKKVNQGGYCFPAVSQDDPRGVPQCQCFKALPDF